MLYLLVFAGVFAGLGWLAHKRAKDEMKLYSKLAAISLFLISGFFLYQFAYYQMIGFDLARYGTTGITITNSDTNATTTFYDVNDQRVKEYLALTAAGADPITLISNIIPILAVLLGAYLLWYYVEEGLFSRDGDRMT